jgi:hypothetical protein
MKKKCTYCKKEKTLDVFIDTENIFFVDKKFPICLECLNDFFTQKVPSGKEWDTFNKFCQTIDIYFDPQLYQELRDIDPENALILYMKKAPKADTVDWNTLNRAYLKLVTLGEIHQVHPVLEDGELLRLKDAWGEEYLQEECLELEKMLKSWRQTQAISNHNQLEDTKRLCKIALQMDKKVRAGEDIDKVLKTYVALKDSLGFSNKSKGNSDSIETVGEMFSYLEKSGWLNTYYQGEENDELDKTILEMQAWTKRVVIDNSEIGDQLEATLKQVVTLLNKSNKYEELPSDEDIDEAMEQEDNELVNFFNEGETKDD